MKEVDWENGPFTAEDFSWCSLHFGQLTQVVDRANARFRELLAQCAVVYYGRNWGADADVSPRPGHTHKAYLVGIKKLEGK